MFGVWVVRREGRIGDELGWREINWAVFVVDGSCRSGVMIYRAVRSAVMGQAQHNDGLRWAVVSVKGECDGSKEESWLRPVVCRSCVQRV